MCPDQESNWRPFSLQAGAQSTEPQQPGQQLKFYGNTAAPMCLYVVYGHVHAAMVELSDCTQAPGPAQPKILTVKQKFGKKKGKSFLFPLLW